MLRREFLARSAALAAGAVLPSFAARGARALAVAAPPTLRQVRVAVRAATARQVLVEYASLSGSNPAVMGNFAALWQETDEIGWDDAPLARAPVPATGITPTGSMILETRLQAKPYLLGYGVGTGTGSICATAAVVVGGGQDPTKRFASSLSLIAASTDSMILGYEVPQGSRPKEFGHRLGIWEGGAFSYTRPPLVTFPLVEDLSESTVGLQYPLLAQSTYTIGYFTDAAPTALACALSFSTADTVRAPLTRIAPASMLVPASMG